MKKILICGSAGFLMSNLVRYMTYRTKDYEFVSVDKLVKTDYYKLVYVNRNHKFYIGDVTDKNFMDRIVEIEKPDIIINGINCEPIHSLLDIYSTHYLGSAVLSSYNLPVIHLTYPEGTDEADYFRSNINLTLKNKGIVVELPNCFGMRQKSNFGFAKVLKEVVKYTYEECLYHIEVEVSNEAAPWVYAEDVASFIWYLIEQKDFGKNGRIVRIPHLGITSVKLMAEVAQKILGKHIDYEIVEPWKQFVLNYECDVKTNWIPDSKNMEESLKKTINWYIANQWIFNI